MKKLLIPALILLMSFNPIVFGNVSSAIDDSIVNTNVISDAMFIYSKNFLVLYDKNNEVQMINTVTNSIIPSYTKSPLAIEYSNYLKRNNIFEDNKPQFIGTYMFYVDKTGMSCFDYPTGELLWKNENLYDRYAPKFIDNGKLYLDVDVWNYIFQKPSIKVVDISNGAMLDEFVPNIKKKDKFTLTVAMFENDLILYNDGNFCRYDVKNKKSKWESNYFVGTKFESVTIANGKLLFKSDFDYSDECLTNVPRIRIVDLNDEKTVNEFKCDKFVVNNGFVYSSYCLYCDTKNGKIIKYDINANKIVLQKNISEFSKECFIDNKICFWNDYFLLSSYENNDANIKLSLINKSDFSLKQSILFENRELYSMNQERGVIFITTHNSKLKKPELFVYFDKSFLLEILKDYIREILGIVF